MRYLNAVFIAACFALSLLSFQFPYGRELTQTPFELFLALCILISACYLLMIYKQVLNRDEKVSLKYIVGMGLIARLVLFPSLPILEDDSYRYFYDGALINQEINPYTTPPVKVMGEQNAPDLSILGFAEQPTAPDPQLSFLQDEPLVQRVAYPHLGSIYPPLAQIAFWISHKIDAFSIKAWRLVLLVADLIGLILLIKSLNKLSIPLSRIAIYWLNPIVLVYGYNAGHMDVLLLPFFIGVVVAVQSKRLISAAICMACAVGIKLWPVILAPVLFRPWLVRFKKLLICGFCFILFSALLLLPMFLGIEESSSGLQQFSSTWRTNAFLFGLLEDSLFYLQALDIVPYSDPSLIARILSYSCVLLVVLWRVILPHQHIDIIISSFLWITTALFLLAPTGYPWYAIWLLPWLVYKPTFPLLLLSCTLMLYPIRFALMSYESESDLLSVLTFLEFFPVVMLLLFKKTRYLGVKCAT